MPCEDEPLLRYGFGDFALCGKQIRNCLPYFGHSLHGFGHQLFNEVGVITPYAFKTFEFDGLIYIRHLPTITDGVITPPMDSLVRVTDVERTVIDCIDRIKYAGGLEELLNNLSSITFINENKLLNYLDAYNKAALYQKTGFLLSNYKKQMRLSQGFFRQCKANIGKSTRYLEDVAEKTKYNAEWHLCIPENITSMTEKGGIYV